MQLNKTKMKKLILILICACSYSYASDITKDTARLYKQIRGFCELYNNGSFKSQNLPYPLEGNLRIDTIILEKQQKFININFSSNLSYTYWRPESSSKLYDLLKSEISKKSWWQFLTPDFKGYDIIILSDGHEISKLIPNFFRKLRSDYDEKRILKVDAKDNPIITRDSKPYDIKNGLKWRNLAVWHSHGWYFEPKLNRWEWQRARLFETVEDIFPMSFVIPYIVPMLENAGANVFLPRERDIQSNEVIVDNDTCSNNSEFVISGDWQTSLQESGFAIGNPPYLNGTNPFKQGTYVQSSTQSQISYIANIEESGEYAVYISYKTLPTSSDKVKYIVNYLGGKTEFSINQKMGGGTWIYLGTFKFAKGKSLVNSSVSIINEGKDIVTSDAVRFGGGMGSIARNVDLNTYTKAINIKDADEIKHIEKFLNQTPRTSKRPRYVEGARYFLQYSGIPDSLIYSLNKGNDDYKDDYQCRGEWVNFMNTPIDKTYRNSKYYGLGIPIDLSFSFHTDAGETPDNKTIGTLLIYSSTNYDTKKDEFENGLSRFSSRDFADILQTEIDNTIKTQYNPDWRRRSLWDKHYSETWRPDVPSIILELLSHSNFADMKFGKDPSFQFSVSRAIYKGILKFLATQNEFDFIVQPLPINNFKSEFVGERDIKLTWSAVEDTLEPTATAKSFIVYTRKDCLSFDNGILTNNPEIIINNIDFDKIYSFKVAAVNDGGESFPSEILSVCRMQNSNNKIVLVVNAFDRIAEPAIIDNKDLRGFASFIDRGVPYKYAINYIGHQYDYRPDSKWKDDDEPGMGGSFANCEGKIIAGNTFDFTYIHGEAIKNAGYSYVSSSKTAFENEDNDFSAYKLLDIIAGEQKETPSPINLMPSKYRLFTKAMQKRLSSMTKEGTSLFITGSYIGSDVFNNPNADSIDKKFVNKVLKYSFRTSYASKNGIVYCDVKDCAIAKFQFNTEVSDKIYDAEAPDGLTPFDRNGISLMRYEENNISAGVLHIGQRYSVCALGFPFETIKDKDSRFVLMKQVLKYIDK